MRARSSVCLLSLAHGKGVVDTPLEPPVAEEITSPCSPRGRQSYRDKIVVRDNPILTIQEQHAQDDAGHVSFLGEVGCSLSIHEERELNDSLHEV